MKREKQLQGLDRLEIVQKAKGGMALSLKELAVFCGFSYAVVRGWAKEGLPVINGGTFIDDFVIWRRRKTGLESAPEVASRRPVRASGKFCEPL